MLFLFRRMTAGKATAGIIQAWNACEKINPARMRILNIGERIFRALPTALSAISIFFRFFETFQFL
jgi:hypothetical protein